MNCFGTIRSKQHSIGSFSRPGSPEPGANRGKEGFLGIVSNCYLNFLFGGSIRRLEEWKVEGWKVENGRLTVDLGRARYRIEDAE